MSKHNVKPPGFRQISGPFRTPTGKFMITHSAITLDEAKAGLWMSRSDGSIVRRFIVKQRLYKTQKMALRQKERAVQQGWNDFYSANLPMN